MVRNVSAGVLTAVVCLVFNLSYAALIFSGPLAFALPLGVTAAMLSMTCVALLVAILSPFRTVVAGPEGNAVALLAVTAATMQPQLASAGASPHAIVATVLWMMVLVTAVTALALIALGSVRGGGWIRYVPFPVVGGFVAGTAWVLTVGAIKVAAGIPPDLAHARAYADPLVLARLGAAVAFAALVAAEARYVKKALGVPVLLVGVVVLFALALWALHVAPLAAQQAGWLVKAPERLHIWTPWTSHDLNAVVWPAFGRASGELLTVVIVAVVTILFNATGLELETEDDVDLDHELRAEGIANLASALVGGFVGYLSLNRTLLLRRFGGSDRVAGVALAAASALLLLGGWRAIAVVPTFVLAGLLLSLGVQLLYRWLIAARGQLAPLEYGALLLIFGVIVVWGFLTGLIVGVVAGALLFAFNYSRIDVVKHSMTGAQRRSSLVRPLEELAILADDGWSIRIFELQGFVFFGMADRLFRNAKAEIERPNTRFCVFDFRMVVGMDASGVSSFVKAYRAAEARGVRLVFSGMNERVANDWVSGAAGVHDGIEHFGGLDHALEWCEDQLIVPDDQPDLPHVPLGDWLEYELRSADLAQRLLAYLQPRTFGVGEALCRQNEHAESMFFIESGRVRVVLENDDGSHLRLRSLGDRTILGEIGLYRDTRRSATALADRPSVVHVLTAGALTAMEVGDPALAASLTAAIIRSLGERLEYQSGLVANLQR
ncbi:MAG TPA: SulP family inorganic anion transporter [Candidatus Sulfotelmatobacter sp.]|nr:SulP family inorganic anion transporter [Candidatus Sulfotelmatobacter sp.]